MKTSRILSLILTAAVLLSMVFPLSVFAEDFEFFDEAEFLEEYNDFDSDMMLLDEELIEEDWVVEDEFVYPEYEEVLEDDYITEEFVAEEEPVAEEPNEMAEPEAETPENVSEFELSDNASFDAAGAPVIEVQPADISANDGDRVTLSLTAQNAESYQWYYSKDGTTWVKCTATYYPGCKTNSIEFDALLKRDGWQFKCVVTGKGETIESNVVTLTVALPYIVLNDVKYEPIDSNSCKVISYAGAESTLIIPETVEGMTVVEIGEEAFMDNTTLASIDLPDTITAIRARAFKNCTNLKEMK